MIALPFQIYHSSSPLIDLGVTYSLQEAKLALPHVGTLSFFFETKLLYSGTEPDVVIS